MGLSLAILVAEQKICSAWEATIKCSPIYIYIYIFYILFKSEEASLNKREEIAGHCFHREQALLKNS